MAFFQIILKARKLRKARLIYHDEKLKSIEISKGAKVHYTLGQRIRYTKILLKKKLKATLQKITTCPEDSWFHEKAVLSRTDGTLENYVLKSVFGFLGGIFLTYLLFIFFVLQLNFSLSSATIWCSLLGIVLTLGLAFSSRVRCVVFLLMPQFFSKRGRQALMAYAFILVLTGPAKNTLHNIGSLSESLACSQEQLKEAVKTIVDLIKQPFYALKDAIGKVIKTVKVVVRKIKMALIAIKRLVLSILKVIQSVFEWLGSIVNMCNKKLGTPFERCNGVFEDAVSDCKAKLGSFFGEICNVTYVVATVCYIVKPLDFICMLVAFVSDAIVGTVRKKIKKFAKHMKTMFYVKVKFSHSFHFESNHSRSISDVSKGIGTEIKLRTERFLMLFDMMSFVTSFFILFLLARVIHYRHKWLTNSRFDNRYLTDYFREIDLRRARLDKETVLPLNSRERHKYIPLSSITLIKVEKIRLAKSAVFLSLMSCKILFHMAVDYCLYWILSMIRYHGRIETKIQQPNSVGVYVSGTGFLADLYKSIVKAFSPSTPDEEINTVPCLPDPIPPDLDRYLQITSLTLLCWLMTIFEPYGLRLRQVVMNSYHPERAKERAVWLYNHILRSRGSFLKFARRQLRRKFGMKGAESTEKVTFRERLTAMCPFLNKLFPLKQNACLLCGAIEREGQLPHIKCPTPGCIGLFCVQCFSDLQNICTVCKTPLDYGDLSDISQEKDSSEEDVIQVKKSSTTDVKEEDTEITEDTGDVYETEEGVQVREEDIDAISSSTEYSYTYQDDESQVYKHLLKKESYRDIEAQKMRDDVTTQIFSCPIEDVDSGSETPTCFMFRARRRLKSQHEQTMTVCPNEDKSTFVAASPSSEEIDEEELITIKLEDDSSDKLLSSRYVARKRKKKKRGRIKNFFAGLLKFSWFRRRKRSIKSERKGKKDDEMLITCSCTSSSFSSTTSSSSSYNLNYRETYNSHRGNQRKKRDNRDLEYPHEKRFSTKKLPKGLMSVAKETRYFEVDERVIHPSKFEYDKEGLNILSDVKTSSDTSRITETWNICGDDEYHTYRSWRSEEGIETKISASSVMTTIEEDSQETSWSKNSPDDCSESSDDSKKYIDVTSISNDSLTENEVYPEHSSVKISKYKEIKRPMKSDKIEEKRTQIIKKNKNKKDTSQVGKNAHEVKSSKIIKCEISPKTREARAHHHRKSVERRLQRRRYDQNYYSSSDNEVNKKNVDESSIREKKVQGKQRSNSYDDESPKRGKQYLKTNKSQEKWRKGIRKDQCHPEKYGPGFKPILYCKCKQGSENYAHRDSSEFGEKSSSENSNSGGRSFQCPIHREQNFLNQRPELIEELKDDDRIKLIRKREDERQRRYEILRFIREQGKPQREVPKFCRKPPRTISTNKRGYTLPYQETETFKNLVKEYQQKAFAEEKIISEKDHLILPSEDESKEVDQLLPLESYPERPSVVSRFRKKVEDVFKTNKYHLKDANNEEIDLLMDYPVEAALVGQLESESSSDMSSYAHQRIHQLRKKYCPDHEKSITTPTDDTTDNNETTH